MLAETWDQARSKLKNILAVRMDNIGDVIMLGPALRELKKNLPLSHLTLLASPAGGQAGALLPWIDEVLTWRATWQDASGNMPLDASRELKLVEMLREREIDAALIFTSFSQSPYPPAFACYLAEIPFRLGFSKEFGGSLLTHWWKSPADEGHQAERNLELLEKAGFSVQDRSLELHIPTMMQSRSDVILSDAGVDPTRPFICLAPGASCAARRFDPTRFDVVAQSLAELTGFQIVIIGSATEAEQIAPALVSAGKQGIVSLVGQTTIPEVADVIRRSALVIANNSASMHIADAFQRPMVILYSGTENESQFIPRNSAAYVLRKKTLCSPCRNFTCPYSMECLDITPEEVIHAAINLLSLPEQGTGRKFDGLEVNVR